MIKSTVRKTQETMIQSYPCIKKYKDQSRGHYVLFTCLATGFVIVEYHRSWWVDSDFETITDEIILKNE